MCYIGFSFDNIEIPISAITDGTLNMVMVVMSTQEKASANLTIMTQYVRKYENALYELNEDGNSYTFVSYKNFYFTPVALELPSHYNSKPITKIGDNAFYYHMALTSVVIPDTVTEVGAFAFSTCEKLQSVTLSQNLQILNEEAFGHTAIASINLPNKLQYIGETAFTWCESLQAITIPSSVKTIGASAFYHCSQLATVTLSEGLEEIGWKVFNESLIETVIVPSTVTKIADEAFSGCKIVTIKKGTKLENAPKFRTTENWYTTSTFEANSKVNEIPAGEFTEDITYYCKTN